MESKPRVSFEFEVEKIIGVSNDGMFQVQWAPAWVNKFHLVGCEHLIQEFLQQRAEEKTSSGTVVEAKIEDMSSAMEVSSCSRNIDMTENVSHKHDPLSTFAVQTAEENIEAGINGCPGTENVVVPSNLPSGSEHTIAPTKEFSDHRHEHNLAETVPENLKYESDSRKSSSCTHHSFDATDNELIQKCNACGMEIHLTTHSSLKSKTSHPYSCDLCNYLCTKKFDLKRHMRTHTGERPFSCESCGRSFSQKCHLNRHIRIHTAPKQHSCDGCGQLFADLVSLKHHGKHCSYSIDSGGG